MTDNDFFLQALDEWRRRNEGRFDETPVTEISIRQFGQIIARAQTLKQAVKAARKASNPKPFTDEVPHE